MRRYKQNEINELVKILKNNGVISVPTDTVYGVCSRISSIEAYKNLIRIKNRPSEKSFPIMCSDEEQIKSVAVVDRIAECLIHNFMPGPITLVLKKKPEVPQYVNNGKETIAVRMATSKVLEELIRKNGSPIFMSSANQSGEPTCTTLDEIEEKCPLLDGIMEGHVVFGKSSTIVDCTSNPVKILRNGPITIEQIEKVLKNEKNSQT